MSDFQLGILLAAIGSVFMGAYIIPKKLSRLDSRVFLFYLSIGFFIGSTFLYLIHIVSSEKTEVLTNPYLLFSALAGALWSVGFYLLLQSVDEIGLTKSNQWKNLQGPIGVLFTIIFLREYLRSNWIFSILAGLAVFLSALFFNIGKKKNGSNTKGILYATLAALCFGVVTLLNKITLDHSGVYAQQMIISLFLLLSCTHVLIVKKVSIGPIFRVDSFYGLLSGILYLGASSFMLYSYKFIPASIGYTVIQLNAIWVISIGIFVFKEINYKKHWLRLVLGLIFALVGISMLFLAKK